MQFVVFGGKKFLCVAWESFYYTRNQYVGHVPPYLLLLCLFVVLCADHNGLHSLGTAVVAVLHCHLAFCVGTQVLHLLPFVAYLRKFHHDDVGKGDGQRHEFGSLTAGIAKHHSLVAGALLFAGLPYNALVYIAALLMYGTEYAATVGLEFILPFGVADTADDIAHCLVYVYVCLGPHFAADND